jgi:F-type H+-transporting ATPase subunit c
MQTLQTLAQTVAHVQIVTIVAATCLICIAAVATAISFSLLGGKFLDGIARQPELMGAMTTRMFLIAGLVDAFAAVSVAMGLYLIFAKNPFLSEVLKIAGQTTGA